MIAKYDREPPENDREPLENGREPPENGREPPENDREPLENGREPSNRYYVVFLGIQCFCGVLYFFWGGAGPCFLRIYRFFNCVRSDISSPFIIHIY